MQGLGPWFWILMLLAFLVNGYGFWTNEPNGNRWRMGGGLLLFALLFLIGWQLFNFPLNK